MSSNTSTGSNDGEGIGPSSSSSSSFPVSLVLWAGILVHSPAFLHAALTHADQQGCTRGDGEVTVTFDGQRQRATIRMHDDISEDGGGGGACSGVGKSVLRYETKDLVWMEEGREVQQADEVMGEWRGWQLVRQALVEAQTEKRDGAGV